MCNKSVIGLVHSGNEDEIGYIILPHTNENKSNIINIKHDGVTITLSHYIESLHWVITLSYSKNIVGGTNSAKYYTNDSLMVNRGIKWIS